MFCPKCGAENPDGVVLCWNCTYRFVPPVPDPLAPQVAYQPGSPQQPSPQVVYVETPSQKTGCLSVSFGLFTVLAGLFWVVSGIGGGGLVLSQEGATMFALTTGCIPALLGLFGIMGGAILAARGGALGAVLTTAFWVVSMAICLCIGLLLLLFMGPSGLTGY